MIPILLTFGDVLDKVFYSFDQAVFQFFGSLQNDFLTAVANFFTNFGDELFIIPILVLSIVLCFFKKTRKYGFSILFAIIVGTLLTNVVCKPYVGRTRPYNTLQFNEAYMQWYTFAGQLNESDASFPSGHTTGAFEIATAMFICMMKDNKKKLAWIFPAIALCTAGSRIYLMVHYPSDVVGGMIVGIVSGIAGWFLMTLVMKIKALEKIDAEKLFKKGINSKAGSAVIAAAVAVIFCIGYIPSINPEPVERCAYTAQTDDGTEICYNEGKDDRIIDGKKYCKQHYKLLAPEEAE